jgi:hypothetical protein
MGEGDAAERRCGPASKGAGRCREADPVFRGGGEVSPNSGGREVPWVMRWSLRAKVRARVLGLGRVRESEVRERSLEGQKPRRATAGGTGQPGSLRTDSRREERSEASEAGGDGRLSRSRPRATGKWVRARGKGVHSQRGNQATAFAWASVKPQVTRSRAGVR